MKKEIKEKMIEIGYTDIKDYNYFLFGINKNGYLVKITALQGHQIVNVNILENQDGHSYSYYVDLLRNEQECLLEKYYTIDKDDLLLSKKIKLN